DLPAWLQATLRLLLVAAPYILWIAFCLWAVNWKKMGPVLREGAWLPALLLIGLVALVWSKIVPSSVTILGQFRLPNFWWQLGFITTMAGVGLFAGWVQNKYSLTPEEIPVEPPAHEHGHDHDHGHGH